MKYKIASMIYAVIAFSLLGAHFARPSIVYDLWMVFPLVVINGMLVILLWLMGNFNLVTDAELEEFEACKKFTEEVLSQRGKEVST